MKKHKDKIIGLVISLIFLGLIFWKLDFHQLVLTFKTFDYRVLLLFVPLYVLSIFIRGARWKYLLCEEAQANVKPAEKLSVTEAFFAFTAGNTLNSYLPARAGDFWRAYHVGNKIGESKMKILGSVILERLIDGISILLILYLAILLYFNHPWIVKIACLSGALFIGALLFFYILFKSGKIKSAGVFFEKLCEIKMFRPCADFFKKVAFHMESFISGFGALNSPKCFSMAFLLSVLAWSLECVVTYILLTGFGHHFGFSIALFVISFVALSTVIPSSSVFVGPYQFAYILALSIYHVDKSQALGIAFIHQMTIMIVITMISILYFSNTSITFKGIKAEIEEEQSERDAESE